MRESGIDDGDLALVDRALDPGHVLEPHSTGRQFGENAPSADFSRK